MTSWAIHAEGQTLVLASDGGVPCAVYWGPPLPDSDIALMEATSASEVTGGMLDANPRPSLCPEASLSFPGLPGLVLYRDGAPLYPRFRLIEADGRQFTVRDEALGLSLRFAFDVEGPVINAQTVLVAEDPVTLHHLAAPALPGLQCRDILHFSGRWIGEFQPMEADWQSGCLLCEARTGLSGHEHPPLAFFRETGCTNTEGTAFGMHYGWPGGHAMRAEELPDGRRQIQWGHPTGTQGTGTSVGTAPLLLTVSTAGLNG